MGIQESLNKQRNPILYKHIQLYEIKRTTLFGCSFLFYLLRPFLMLKVVEIIT